MKRRAARLALYTLGAVLPAGCAALPAPVELDLAGVKPSTDVSDLAAVLAEAVTDDGRVEPAALRRVSDRLERQLRRLAVTGPTATPDLFRTYGSRWAYWLNARAAWSLKLAARAGWPRRTCPLRMRRRRFPLDGRTMSLEEIDRILLTEAVKTGDFRLAACAPGVLIDYAPMPKTPFAAGDLARRLEQTFQQLVLEQRRFVIDVEARKVRVPPMLWACRRTIKGLYAAEYGAPPETSLITAVRPYVTPPARRRLEEAWGYRAVPQRRRRELAIPRRKLFAPGKVGRIEP